MKFKNPVVKHNKNDMVLRSEPAARHQLLYCQLGDATEEEHQLIPHP